MKILRSPITPSSEVIRLSCRITGWFLFQFLILSPLVSSQVRAAQKSDPVSKILPLEHGTFEQMGKPHEDDTPGVLKYGGYLWRDVHVTTLYYRVAERKIGGAQVETIDHAHDYPYVIHDFFGTFRKVGTRTRTPPHNIDVVNGFVNEDEWMWRFLDWASDENRVTGNICVTVIQKGDGVFGGTVGWYSRGDDGIRTVLIGYDQVDGVPFQLINEYLKKYPSSVKESDFHGETWVADDVHKWIHLLQLHKSDKMMFEMALGHLAAYDKRFFGDRDAFLTAQAAVRAGDTTTVEKVVQDLKLDAERWLQNRATKNRQKKGD